MQRVVQRKVFEARKGRSVGAYRVPPIVWDGFSLDMCYVNFKNPSLILTNHDNLYLLDLRRKTHRLLKEPLGKQQEFVSVAATVGLCGYEPVDKLYIFLFCSDYTVALIDGEGRLCERFGGFSSGSRGTPGGFSDFPRKTAISTRGTLLLLMGTTSRYLLEIDSQGRQLGRWAGIQGFAVAPDGKLFVSGDKETVHPNDWQWIYPPVEVNPNHEALELIGVDRSKSAYWQRVHSGKMEIIKVAPNGHILLRMELNDQEGVIPAFKTGRHQIDRICLGGQNQLFVVGYNYDSAGRICVYELSTH